MGSGQEFFLGQTSLWIFGIFKNFHGGPGSGHELISVDREARKKLRNVNKYWILPSKHKTLVQCLQNVLLNICKMLLKMFTNIKMFDLIIIAIKFLVIFQLPFSQHFEIN